VQTCRVNRAAIPKLLPNISSGLILTGLCGQDVLCPYVAAVGTSLRWHLPGSPTIPGLRPLFANLPNIRMENLKELLTDIVFGVVLFIGNLGQHGTHLPPKPRNGQRKGLVPWRRKGISTATRVATHQSEEPSIGPPIAGEESPIFHMIR
jgi:hypothetical protein